MKAEGRPFGERERTRGGKEGGVGARAGNKGERMYLALLYVSVIMNIH